LYEITFRRNNPSSEKTRIFMASIIDGNKPAFSREGGVDGSEDRPEDRSKEQSEEATPLKQAVFCGPGFWIDRVYAKGRQDRVAQLTSLYPHLIDLDNFEQNADQLRDVQVIFSTWGIPKFTPGHLDRMKSLEAVFYAGGTVKSFAAELLRRNIIVVSAWQANAVPVSEFTLAQILLGMKGYFRNVRDIHNFRAGGEPPFQGPGNFGETAAILGAGAIGTRVIEMLRQFEMRIVVFDPYLSEERAASLGVEKVTLEQAFKEAFVISNHLANVPATRALLRGDLFASMRPGATFINTGRGETVDEPAMTAILASRPDITALLDVTHPEPPPPDSPLYDLPNVRVSGHIARSINDELVRMADYCIEDYIAFVNKRPLRYAVTLSMLETMA